MPIHADRMPWLAAATAIVFAAPDIALAYGGNDAIRDCESRIRSEYDLSDLRDATATKLADSEHHYQVKGKTKIDGKKYPWSCEVKKRHVTTVNYDGPRPEGMGTAEKLAIGAAAAIAAGVAATQMGKKEPDAGEETSSQGGTSAEYRRGYADGMRGYFDTKRHPQDYKDGYRDAEQSGDAEQRRGGGYSATANAGAGGPDFYRVVGVALDDTLSVRARPDANAKRLGTIPHTGNCLRNLGCDTRMAWCKVEYRGITGYVAGKYLAETGGCD